MKLSILMISLGAFTLNFSGNDSFSSSLSSMQLTMFNFSARFIYSPLFSFFDLSTGSSLMGSRGGGGGTSKSTYSIYENSRSKFKQTLGVWIPPLISSFSCLLILMNKMAVCLPFFSRRTLKAGKLYILYRFIFLGVCNV